MIDKYIYHVQNIYPPSNNSIIRKRVLNIPPFYKKKNNKTSGACAGIVYIDGYDF